MDRKIYNEGIRHGRIDRMLDRRAPEGWLDHASAYAREYWQGYAHGWAEWPKR